MAQRTKEGKEGTRIRRRGSNVAPLVSPCKAGYVGRVGGRGPETLPREMRRQTHSGLQRKRSQSLLILVSACHPQKRRKGKGFLSLQSTAYLGAAASINDSTRRVSQPTNARARPVPDLLPSFLLFIYLAPLLRRSVEFGMQRRDH